MWSVIAKLALSVLITAVGKVPPDQWAKLGTLIQDWLQKLTTKLGASHPVSRQIDGFRVPRDG